MYLKRHKSKVLLTIWVAGAVLSSVQLFQTQAVPFRYGNETLYDCKELWTEEQGKYFTVILLVFTFVLPISTLVFVYASIAIHLIRNTAPGNAHTDRDLNQWMLKIKVGGTHKSHFIFLW